MSRSANGASRFGLYLGIAASGLMLLGGIGTIFYVGFKVQSNSDILESTIRRIDVIDTTLSITRDRLTKIEVSQNEIETQFCAQDIVRNLMHATDMRNLSILWEKQFGVPYPTNNSYYPTICNRRTKE
jgi:hypothetical protein